MQQATIDKTAKQKVIAICGNPNCGKTTIFNYITGLNQQVGNYPGVTVEKISGKFSHPSLPNQSIQLIDIPGTYSLSAFTPDEFIAASVLFGNFTKLDKPDVIIAIIDATNLERSLYFLLQVQQTGIPVVVGLNMSDLAAKKRIFIDRNKLSELLGGMPVVDLIGNRGIGVEELKEQAVLLLNSDLRTVDKYYSHETENAVEELMQLNPQEDRSRAHLLRIIFDAGGPAEEQFLQIEGAKGEKLLTEIRKKIIKEHSYLSQAETSILTKKSEEIFNQVITKPDVADKTNTERVDRYLLHPVLGPIILFGLMYFVFQSIFSWAEPFMGVIEQFFGMIASSVESMMAEGPLRSLLTDGVIGGVGGVLVFIPQIVILFFFIAILEDSGYMPRAAFLVDRMFRWCGLSGKSFIPMLSSFACAIPGIMATRTIEDKKLRFITIMVAPLMTCSARLPVYAIMIAAFVPYKTYFGIANLQGLTLTLLYLLGIVVAVFVSFILKKTIFKTERGTFLMEMPSYKVPTAKSVLIRVFNRAKHFVIRAGTVIMAITIIIWALSYYPHQDENTLSAVRNAEINQTVALSEMNLDKEFYSLTDTFSEAQTAEVLSIETAYTGVTSEVQISSIADSLISLYPGYTEIIALYQSHELTKLTASNALDNLSNEIAGTQIRNSYLGKAGKTIEPFFEPLGWDWKITVSVLASFPAREVIIAVLGTIYNLGSDVDEESTSLIDQMRQATWEDGEKAGMKVFSVPVAISIMVFFALCCQCGATLVTIKQETKHWGYPIGVFVYMTTLAYLGSFAAYQILTSVGL